MEESLKFFLFKVTFVVAFMSFAIYLGRPFEPSNCKRNRFFSTDSFSGKVISKTRNGVGNYENIKLNTGEIFSWEDDFFGEDSYLIYDKILIGDSIIKRKNELVISVYRSDSMFVLDLELPCDEK